MPGLFIPKCSHAIQFPFCISPDWLEAYALQAVQAGDVELLEEVLLKEYPIATIQFLIKDVRLRHYAYTNKGEPSETAVECDLVESWLHFACKSSNEGKYTCKLCNFSSLQLIQILVENCGLEVNRHNSLYQTPLHVAAQHGTISHVEELLFYGAQLNCMDVKDNSPLHIAG